MGEVDVARHLEGLRERPQRGLDASQVVLTDGEAVHNEALALLARLIGEGCLRRDRAGVQRRSGREHLHDRARDVESLAGTRQERFGRVVAQRVHRPLRDLWIARDRGRVEGRGRDERQHRAGLRVERHHRPGIGAELRRGKVLQPPVDGECQVAWLWLPGEDVAEQIANRVRIGLADQDVLECPLQPGASESEARVADDVGEGRIGIGAAAQPVDHLGGGEHLAGGVEDRAARQAASRGDDLRVVWARREALGLDHLPPGDAARDDGESEHEVHAQSADVGGDHESAARSAVPLRWLIARSSPIMMKLASTLEPP